METGAVIPEFYVARRVLPAVVHVEATRTYPEGPPRLAPGWIHVDAGVHPEHGDAVTYVPGIALPGWLRELLAGGATLAAVGDGEFRLVLPGRPVPRGASRPGGKETRS